VAIAADGPRIPERQSEAAVDRRVLCRKRCRETVLLALGSAAQAAVLVRIPAVGAGVLAARQAEQERLMERVELAARQFALLVASGIGQGIVERGLVAGDEIDEAFGQDLELAQPLALGRSSFEGVASATPFAE
jgi:hypothetical protein